jgi:hypothetical protein
MRIAGRSMKTAALYWSELLLYSSRSSTAAVIRDRGTRPSSMPPTGCKELFLCAEVRREHVGFGGILQVDHVR